MYPSLSNFNRKLLNPQISIPEIYLLNSSAEECNSCPCCKVNSLRYTHCFTPTGLGSSQEGMGKFQNLRLQRAGKPFFLAKTGVERNQAVLFASEDLWNGHPLPTPNRPWKSYCFPPLHCWETIICKFPSFIPFTLSKLFCHLYIVPLFNVP